MGRAERILFARKQKEFLVRKFILSEKKKGIELGGEKDEKQFNKRAGCQLFCLFVFPAINIRDLVGQREEKYLCGIFLGCMNVDFILNVSRHTFHIQG